MTADAILWPPPLARRRPQIAAVIAGLFLAVLGLGRLATVETPAPFAEQTAPAPADPVRRRGPIAAPAAALRFRLAATAPGDEERIAFDPDTSASLARWASFLHEQGSDRVVLTLAAAPDAPPIRIHRVGAALVRRLAGADVNPHRLRLVLAEAGDAAGLALGGGEYHLAIEVGTR